MSKGPKGGRPPGRRGRGGVGPGPGYRPGGGGGGTKHGGSTGTRAMVWMAAAVFGSFGALVLTAVGYVVVGHVSS